MANRLPFALNGKNFADAVNKYGYTVSYEPVYGPNGGMMQDGTEIVDLVGWRPVIALQCNPLDSARQAELLSECLVDYVLVDYFSPKLNNAHQEWFIPSVGETNVGLYGQDGKLVFTGLTLLLGGKQVIK